MSHAMRARTTSGRGGNTARRVNLHDKRGARFPARFAPLAPLTVANLTLIFILVTVKSHQCFSNNNNVENNRLLNSDQQPKNKQQIVRNMILKHHQEQQQQQQLRLQHSKQKQSEFWPIEKQQQQHNVIATPIGARLDQISLPTEPLEVSSRSYPPFLHERLTFKKQHPQQQQLRNHQVATHFFEHKQSDRLKYNPISSSSSGGNVNVNSKSNNIWERGGAEKKMLKLLPNGPPPFRPSSLMLALNSLGALEKLKQTKVFKRMYKSKVYYLFVDVLRQLGSLMNRIATKKIDLAWPHVATIQAVVSKLLVKGGQKLELQWPLVLLNPHFVKETLSNPTFLVMLFHAIEVAYMSMPMKFWLKPLVKLIKQPSPEKEEEVWWRRKRIYDLIHGPGASELEPALKAAHFRGPQDETGESLPLIALAQTIRQMIGQPPTLRPAYHQKQQQQQPQQQQYNSMGGDKETHFFEPPSPSPAWPQQYSGDPLQSPATPLYSEQMEQLLELQQQRQQQQQHQDENQNHVDVHDPMNGAAAMGELSGSDRYNGAEDYMTGSQEAAFLANQKQSALKYETAASEQNLVTGLERPAALASGGGGGEATRLAPPTTWSRQNGHQSGLNRLVGHLSAPYSPLLPVRSPFGIKSPKATPKDSYTTHQLSADAANEVHQFQQQQQLMSQREFDMLDSRERELVLRETNNSLAEARLAEELIRRQSDFLDSIAQRHDEPLTIPDLIYPTTAAEAAAASAGSKSNSMGKA